MWLLLLGCVASPALPAEPIPREPVAETAAEAPPAPPPSEVALRTVVSARAYAGTSYRWEGRATERLPGLDCLGLLFRAHGEVTGTSWRAYPVNPSELVASGLLGAPVDGLDGVPRESVDPAALLPGDILYFLLEGYTIADAPLWTHEEASYWPWHTGLYVGEGRVLQAEPGSVVRERGLDEIRHDALFVTRVR